jgi:5'-phosphate synthase pdxT subunit
MSKGITRLGLWDPLRAFVELGRPVLGTCAGAILLARDVPHQSVPTLGVLDARASRNAYGTQVDSFAATADPDAAQGFADLPCVFIRAPKLGALGPEVEVLARVDGEPVLVRQHRVLASTFHPELSRDARVHQLLVDACGDEGRAV